MHFYTHVICLLLVVVFLPLVVEFVSSLAGVEMVKSYQGDKKSRMIAKGPPLGFLHNLLMIHNPWDCPFPQICLLSPCLDFTSSQKPFLTSQDRGLWSRLCAHMCHRVELSPLPSPLPVCMCYVAGPCLSSYSPWDPQPPSTLLLLTSSVLYVHNELRGHEPRKQVN